MGWCVRRCGIVGVASLDDHASRAVSGADGRGETGCWIHDVESLEGWMIYKILVCVRFESYVGV